MAGSRASGQPCPVCLVPGAPTDDEAAHSPQRRQPNKGASFSRTDSTPSFAPCWSSHRLRLASGILAKVAVPGRTAGYLGRSHHQEIRFCLTGQGQEPPAND